MCCTTGNHALRFSRGTQALELFSTGYRLRFSQRKNQNQSCQYLRLVLLLPVPAAMAAAGPFLWQCAHGLCALLGAHVRAACFVLRIVHCVTAPTASFVVTSGVLRLVRCAWQRDVKVKSPGALGYHVIPSDLSFRYLCLTSSGTSNATASIEHKLHPE